MFCLYCFHRKSVSFLWRRRPRMTSQLSSKKRGRWVWWHLLFQRGTTVTRLCLWILLYMTTFCLPEEKEDYYRCLVLIWAKTWLCGRPAEPGDAVLLRQTVCDRAGGAQIAGWVRTGPPLSHKVSHNLLMCCFTKVTVCAPAPFRLLLPVQ